MKNVYTPTMDAVKLKPGEQRLGCCSALTQSLSVDGGCQRYRVELHVEH